MPDAQAKPVFMGGLMRLEEMNLFGEEPVAQTVKNLPAVWETRVQTLDREDPLEEGMATHSSIFAWRILMNRGAWKATVCRVAKSWTLLNN